jgi:hypothetical protein
MKLPHDMTLNEIRHLLTADSTGITFAEARAYSHLLDSVESFTKMIIRHVEEYKPKYVLPPKEERKKKEPEPYFSLDGDVIL